MEEGGERGEAEGPAGSRDLLSVLSMAGTGRRDVLSSHCPQREGTAGLPVQHSCEKELGGFVGVSGGLDYY